MISYKLAKELKDAGFPQAWNDGRDFFRGDGVEVGPVRRSNDVLVDFTSGYTKPTLSELIEACGPTQGILEFNLHATTEEGICTWYAAYGYGMDDSAKFLSEGTTPSEAVARLWLALNKKP